MFFSVQGIGGSPTGPHLENRVGDQDTGSPGRRLFWVASAQWARALLCKNKTTLVTFLWHFSFKMPFNCTSRDEYYSALIVWPFGRKSMRRMPSWSQKIEARTFPAIFALGIFWGRVSCYAATPLIVALSPGHSDITRFHPWPPIVTGNHLDRMKKFQKFLRRLAPLTFLIHVQAFHDPLCRELPHVQIFMNDRPNPLTRCPFAQLLI